MRVEGLGKLRLHLDVAHLSGSIPRLQIVDFRRVRIERVMVEKDRIPLHGSRNIRTDSLRIGVHLHHFFPHRLRVVREIDRVGVALRHLSIVEAGKARDRRQQRLRLDEELPVEVVVATHDLATQLQVRNLILADRHVVRVVNDDVRCLEERISEEPERRQVLLRQLFNLFLVRRNAFEPGNRHRHRQEQVQLGMLRHQRLHEQGAPLRVDAGRNPIRDHVVRVGDDAAGVAVVAGERVPVGDEVEAVVRLLQLGPVLQGSDEMTEVQLPRRAHARHDAWLHGTRIL